MKYYSKFAITAALSLPVAAHAHPGDHGMVASFAGALTHILSQPDHGVLLMAGVAAAIYLLRRYARFNG